MKIVVLFCFKLIFDEKNDDKLLSILKHIDICNRSLF